MTDEKERLFVLRKQGEEFTYNSFASKGQFGNASEHSPRWLEWRARVSSAVTALCAEGAPPIQLLKAGNGVHTFGNGPEKFEAAKGYYLQALNATLDLLDDDLFGETLQQKQARGPIRSSNKVFIVHGHDDRAKQELEIIIGEMGLEPIVLHRQADGGRTLIEKFEHYADVGFAFILLTPDEIAYLLTEESKPDVDRSKENRARPNVIFEFGFFVGRLGRTRTCCIYRGDVSLPTDLQGIIYKKFSSSIEEVGYAIRKELIAAGYKLK